MSVRRVLLLLLFVGVSLKQAQAGSLGGVVESIFGLVLDLFCAIPFVRRLPFCEERNKINPSSLTWPISNVLIEVHPDLGISKEGTATMNSFINEIFESIATEAGKLAEANARTSLTSREIQTTVRVFIPGELSESSVSEGTKAVTRGVTPFQFPLGPIEGYLQQENPDLSVGEGAPIYLAAVLEYLSSVILDLSGNVAITEMKSRIVPRPIFIAVKNDEELNELLGGFIVADIVINP